MVSSGSSGGSIGGSIGGSTDGINGSTCSSTPALAPKPSAASKFSSTLKACSTQRLSHCAACLSILQRTAQALDEMLQVNECCARKSFMQSQLTSLRI